MTADAIPQAVELLKSPENKIIIQKIEKVKIEMVKTDGKGPPRRLSSLFTPAKCNEDPASEAPCPSPSPVQQFPNPATNGFEAPPASIKLLSAKIPGNSCNQTVPLKLVRVIKQPKPKPNLRQRFHRVETFNPVVPQTEPAPTDLDILSLVKIEILEPGLHFNVPSESHKSDSEDEFLGFSKNNQKAVEENHWITLLSGRSQSVVKSEPARSPLKQVKSEPAQSPQKQEIVPMRISQKTELKVVEPTKITKKLEPTVPAVEIPATKGNTASTSAVGTSSQVKPTKPAVAPPSKPKVTDNFLDSGPSTSKEPEKPKTKPPAQLNDFGWQDDILAVIGAARIAKIDETLMEIPNLMTGNAIETENVEFKLIIRHLLRTLKVNSVMETLKFSNEPMDTSKGLQNHFKSSEI